MFRRSMVTRFLAFALLVGVAAIAVEGTHVQPAQAAFASQLTRYPYLTDVTQGFATINWATDRSGTKGSITYGKVGTETCSAHKVSGSKTSIAVKSVNEYQWKAKLTGLQPNAQYCYRVQLGSTDLLGSDPSPVFWSQIPAGNTQPYSFAVFGDWGDTDANGNNPAQAAIMNSIANSGVRFALGTGDTGYDAGTQGNYGDLYQTGYRVSSIFGPNFWAQAGDTVPFFNAVGNHGANATYFNNWPQDRVVANSGGKYAMETYCCANGANSQKSPSSWYAFDAGVARVYVLSAVWSDSNTGTSTDYGMDYAYRWQHNSAEYQWLQNDLQTHPSQLKFAVFHYPLYSDNATEPSDTFLQGSNSLEGLLESNGVNMVFNGHAHLYQHNAAPPGGVVSYTSGGGGATPEPITKCKPNDTYGVGWSQTSGGSSCGAGPKPTQIEQVYHYLKVDVNGYQVTVSGVNALGQTFDTTTYNFSPDTTPPTAPGNLQASAPSGTRVDLTWTASTDAKGVAAYDVYRDGGGSPIATVAGNVTAYSDTTVSQNTAYSYVVKARDPSNNTSDASNTANVTTPSSDGEAPTAPGNLMANAPSATRVDLTWTAATDNSGVIDKYDVYRNGSLNPIATVNGNLTSYSRPDGERFDRVLLHGARTRRVGEHLDRQQRGPGDDAVARRLVRGRLRERHAGGVDQRHRPRRDAGCSVAQRRPLGRPRDQRQRGRHVRLQVDLADANGAVREVPFPSHQSDRFGGSDAVPQRDGGQQALAVRERDERHAVDAERGGHECARIGAADRERAVVHRGDPREDRVADGDRGVARRCAPHAARRGG